MANSIITTDGTNGFGPYTLNFTLGIITRDHVKCRVNAEVDGGGDPVYRDIEWVTDGLVNIDSGAEPDGDDTVRFIRTVPDDALIHDYTDGATIIESNLDESNLQSLMLIHQFLDGRLTEPLQNDLDLGDFKIINLADGTDPTDAINLSQLQPVLDVLEDAQAAAAAAEASADDADADATQTALDRIQTAADRVQTALDVIATAADVVSTGNDADATAADVISTGANVVSAEAAKDAAETAETNAETAETNSEAAAEIAKAAAGFQYTYDAVDTAETDPTSGKIKFNNADLSLATEMYISETTGLAQAIAAEIATWDDSTSTIHSKLRLFKQSNPAIFRIYNVTGTITDNGSWDSITVAYVTGSGAIADEDVLTVQPIRNGDKGDTGAAVLSDGDYGDITVSGTGTVFNIDAAVITNVELANSSVTGFTDTVVLAGDSFAFSDASDSGNLKKDTIQGILDLVPASSLVLLATATASASATLDFTTGITNAYSEFIFVIENLLNATNTRYLQMQTFSNGAWNTANFTCTTLHMDSGGTGTFFGGGTGAIDMMPTTKRQDTSITGENLYGQVVWNALGQASYHKSRSELLYHDEAGSKAFVIGHGSDNNTSASVVSGIRFMYNTGNITSGKIYMYGVKNT